MSALTRAREVLGADTLDTAQAVADHAIDTLLVGDSFVDGPREGLGLLDRPLRPLDGNVEFADALLDLALLTGEDRYEEIAADALGAFAGAADRFGVRIAAYGSAVSRLLYDPLVIAVTDEAGSDLHRAALRMADHEKVVVPDASGYDEAGAAYVVRGEAVAEPAHDPETLSKRVSAAMD